MQELIARSTRLVVMAERGRQMLQEIYQAPPAKIDLIPHGIPDIPFVDPNYYKDQFGVEGRHGVAHVRAALAEQGDRTRAQRAAGDPGGVSRRGLHRAGRHASELSCASRAKPTGSASNGSPRRTRSQKNVIFYNRFVELEELKEFIGAADLYITPYLNEAQITSGTLAYAFGAGKAVVSTPYWHAAELLAEDRGVLVPFGDAEAIAREVIGLLRDETRRHAMRKNAYKLGREMVWSNVARLYMRSFELARLERAVLVAKIVCDQDARPAAARAAGVEAGSSVADDRLDRPVPARHVHRAEFFRRLLHGRQRARLHPRRAAGRAGGRAGTRADAGHHLRGVPASRVRSRTRNASTTT